MKFLSKQFIRPDGDSKLRNKKHFDFPELYSQSKKTDFTLLLLNFKRYFIQLKTNILILLMLVFF